MFSPAGAGAAHAATSAWAAKRDISSDKSYSCTIWRRYNGFFDFSMTNGSDGRTSLTFNFENRSFSTGSTYPVRLYTQSGASEIFEATAQSATQIIVTLGGDSVIVPALQGQNVLMADIGSTIRAVNVYSLSNGLEKMDSCMALSLDDPGYGILTPPPAPQQKPAAQQSSLVRVTTPAPETATAETATAGTAQLPVAAPIQRTTTADPMTSRIASLMAETEPAPQPSSDLLAPAPTGAAGQAATGDPFNSRIHNMVAELSGIATEPPKPLLEPAPEPVGTLAPAPQQQQPQPAATQLAQAPAPVESAPLKPLVKSSQPEPAPTAPEQAAPAQTAPEQAAPEQAAPEQAAPAQTVTAPVKPAPPEWGSAPKAAATQAAAKEPEIMTPPPAVKTAPAQAAVAEPVVQPAAAPVAIEPAVEQPKEILWAHKRITPDPPDFILNRVKEQKAEPDVMLAETRDDVHKPLSMPPELREKEPAADEPGETGALDSEIALTSEPDMAAADEGTVEPSDDLSMEDILNNQVMPQTKDDMEPVKPPPPPILREPARPSDFVEELEADTTLLAQASKIDQANLTAENTDMEMVSNLLEKMRLLEIEKESLRKELASYQTGPVSDIARVESQARKIYALKTRLERLGNENADLQIQLKFNKDKVVDLERAYAALQVQADEAEKLREQVNSLSEQNESLRIQVTELEKEASQARQMRDEDRRRLDDLRDVIGSMSSKLDGLTGSGVLDSLDDQPAPAGDQTTPGGNPPPAGNDAGVNIPDVDPSEFKDFIQDE